MRRSYLFFLLLFFVAYAGFLLYVKRSEHSTASAAAPLQLDRPAILEIPPAVNRSQVTAEPVAPRQAIAIQLSTLTAETSTTPPQQVPAEPTANLDSTPIVGSDNAELSGAADADIRAASIRQFSTERTPDSLRSLQQTVQSDQIARNRLLAVNSLRQLASDDADGAVRSVLRLAMADADPNVVASARDAYQQIEEKTRNVH